MRHAVDIVGYVEVEQFEQRGHQVDTAEQLVVDLGLEAGVPRRPNDHRDSGAGVVQRRLRARQRRTVVGHEHHPCRFVQARLVQCVEQSADGGVGNGDRPVELGQVLPDVGGVGQIVGHHDVIGVGGVIAVAWIRAVCFEEARSEQERQFGRVGEPADGARSTTYSQ